MQWLGRTSDLADDSGGRRIWDQATRRGIWDDHALITALFSTGSAGHKGEPGDLAEGLTDAFVGTFGALEHDQAGAIDALSQHATSAAAQPRRPRPRAAPGPGRASRRRSEYEAA